MTNKKPMIWETKIVKVKDLFPNDKNPRTISKDKFEKLKKQINEVGFHNPPKVDNKGILLGGNQRYRALLDMGAGEIEIPVMYPPKDKKLTKKERDQIIATDNINDGEWDWDILGNEFEKDDLLEWGFTEDELMGSVSEYEGDSGDTSSDDETEKTPYIEVKCKEDDIESLIQFMEVETHKKGFTGVSFEKKYG